MVSNREAVIGPRPPGLLFEAAIRSALFVNLHLSSQTRGRQQLAGAPDLKSTQRTAKVCCPTGGLSAGHVQRVNARLQILVLALDRTQIHAEEELTAVGRPAQV